MPVSIGGSGPITGVTSINTTVSDTELGYLDGVTSALQTQINAKAADSSQGLYLITPTSIANSGGSASASGGTVTFNGVNSISLNGVFSSTYQHYRITFGPVNFSSAGITLINMRLRASGTDLTTNTHAYQIQRLYGAATNAAMGNTGQNSIVLSYASTGASCFYIMDIFDPFGNTVTALTQTHYVYQSDIVTTIWGVGGGYEGTARVNDGFTFYPSAGTTTGTIRVYGYKN